MLEQFLNHIKQQSLFEPTDRIVLAVSGGLDSMVMLHLFRDAGFTVGVAHCNFQLRGLNSDEDELFVKVTCDQLKIPFFSKQFDTEAYSKQNDLSIQMAARELRYEWFSELIKREGFSYVATAHHFNDSIETILMTWVHGGSIDGFAGIPVKNNIVIRPLLFATRNELEDFAKEKQLKWREDTSNKKDDYQRNFIRHQIIPKLKEINPSLELTLQRGVKKAVGDLLFLNNRVEEWKSVNLRHFGAKILINKEGLSDASSSSGFLWRVVKQYGFNFDQCEDVMKSIHGQSGKKFNSSSHQLNIDRDHLILSPLENFWEDVIIQHDLSNATLGNWSMDIEKSTVVDPSKNPLRVSFGSDTLTFPLRWRKWKPGDYFYPLGMEHKRKLSDFLVDNKVSVAEKSQVTVLESNNQIVWVVGYRIDNRFKITSKTQSVYSFSISPHFT